MIASRGQLAHVVPRTQKTALSFAKPCSYFGDFARAHKSIRVIVGVLAARSRIATDTASARSANGQRSISISISRILAAGTHTPSRTYPASRLRSSEERRRQEAVTGPREPPMWADGLLMPRFFSRRAGGRLRTA